MMQNDSPWGLTEALGELQTANAAVTAAAEELNEELESDYTANADGVAAAREDVQDAFDAEVEARDDYRDTTVAQATGELSNGASKYLGSTAKLTEANLTTALNGVQAEINEDDTLLKADGSQRDAGTTLYAVNDIDGEAVYLTAGAGVVAVDDIQEVTISLDTPTADEKITFKVNGTTVTAELTASNGTVDGVTATGLPTGYTADYDDGIVITGPAETTFTLTDVAVADEADTSVTSAEITAYYLDTDAEPAGYVDDAADSLTEGVLDGDKEDDLLEFVTIADLQQSMLDAQNTLANARDTNSDFNVLDTVRAEISAYIAAGGNDIDVNDDASGDLLALRNTIRDLPGTDNFDAAEYELDTAGVPTRDELLIALSGQSQAELNDDGQIVVESVDAPDNAAGQGEWVQGDEVASTDPVQYEWTYQPTAEEQSLLSALQAVETRDDLITAETIAETHFETSATGDGENLGLQLLAIEDRLTELAALEDAVIQAETDFNAANDLIDALEVALDDLADAEAWFTDQDLALPVSLDQDRAGTEDGDIFLFSEDTDGDFTITGFGEEGEDVLYFGGDYALVNLAELGEGGREITDRVGDNDTLEIFWEQSGDDLILYVEAEAEAGFDRGDLALDQMTQVTLAGFDANDITGFDGQILTAGVAPTTEETIA